MRLLMAAESVEQYTPMLTKGGHRLMSRRKP